MTGQIRVSDFSLRNTLESGQFFRWTPLDGGFRIVHAGTIFSVHQEGDLLHVGGAPPDLAARFLALDHDVRSIAASFDGDPPLREALRQRAGLRILRQDPWECAAAFIASMACNIPRITRNVEALAAAFGDRLGPDGLRSFPRPDQMGSETQLRRLGLGFRAKYLAATARLARRRPLETLAVLPTEALREALMEFPGIGEKVADCMALFAFGRLDAFPVDTWIRRVVRRLYLQDARATDRTIRLWARERFGPHAGYAQQYLYAWSRACGRRIFDYRFSISKPFEALQKLITKDKDRAKKGRFGSSRIDNQESKITPRTCLS